MEITTLNTVASGDTLEIRIDGRDAEATVHQIVVSGIWVEVMIQVGQMIYGWDQPSDTEVLVLSRA